MQRKNAEISTVSAKKIDKEAEKPRVYNPVLARVVCLAQKDEATRESSLRMKCSHTTVAAMRRGDTSVRDSYWQAFCDAYAVPWSYIVLLLQGSPPPVAPGAVAVEVETAPHGTLLRVTLPPHLKASDVAVRLFRRNGDSTTEIPINQENGEAMLYSIFVPKEEQMP